MLAEWLQSGRKHVDTNTYTAWIDLNHNQPGTYVWSLIGDQDSFEFLRPIPWIHIQSNQYFLPQLFLHKRYGAWMELLFPSRVVYPALVADIFLPGNKPWAIVRNTLQQLPHRFRHARRIGFQLRSFDELQPRNVDACLKRHTEILTTSQSTILPRVLFVVSLHKAFFKHINATFGDENTLVLQPSADEQQRKPQERPVSLSNNSLSESTSDVAVTTQYINAVAEMWLLALSDVQVVSAESTFGYHAASFAHRVPYVIELRGQRHNNHDLACWPGFTYEPCLHYPHWPNSEEKRRSVGVLRACQDMANGVTLEWRKH